MGRGTDLEFMESALLKVSSDNAFFQAETPEHQGTEWPVVQFEGDGFNLLIDEDDPVDMYLVVGPDYEGTEPIKKMTVYRLVELQTTVIPVTDFE